MSTISYPSMARTPSYWDYNSSERNRSGYYTKNERGESVWNHFSDSQLEAVRSLVDSFISWSTSRGILTNNWHQCASGYIYAPFGGKRPTELSVKIDEIIKTSNGPAWRKAKKGSREIVVSPYYICKGECKVVPVFKRGKKNGDWNRVFISHLNFTNTGFRKQHAGGEGIDMFGGRAKFYVYANITEYVDGMYTRLNPEVLASQILNQYKDQRELDDVLITHTLADADVACMDVLTAMAELPETARSVIDGFRKVAELVEACKKREFALSKAFEKKKAHQQERSHKTLAELQRALALARTPKQRANLRSKIKREEKALQKALLDTAKELADAIANVWLNFRYNIMPIVYTVEDINDLLKSYTAEFKTTRSRESHSVKIVVEGETFDIDVQHKCMIKRLLDPNLRFSSLTSANLLSTGYQLIPWTFVLDWFINAGDVIVASTSPSYALKEGATYSLKANANVISNELGFSCKFESYTREVINPTTHIGLGLNFDLSIFQKYDALALAWGVIRRMLQRSR